jgi:hypothetical protein
MSYNNAMTFNIEKILSELANSKVVGAISISEYYQELVSEGRMTEAVEHIRNVISAVPYQALGYACSNKLKPCTENDLTQLATDLTTLRNLDETRPHESVSQPWFELISSTTLFIVGQSVEQFLLSNQVEVTQENCLRLFLEEFSDNT